MRAYLKERLGAVMLWFLCTAVLALSFALFRLPLRAVWYPAALCLALMLAFGLHDLLRRRRKHAVLTGLQKLPPDLPDELRHFDGADDRDYRALIEALLAQKADREQADAEKLRDMTDYYTTWAHQIKTPIASMRLTLSAEDSPTSRKLSDDLFRIEQYVEMVMGYLRLSPDASDYVIREIPLDGVLKGCIRRFRSQFITKGLTLRYGGTDRTVVSDEKWLSFVIEQVLSNALKYTQTGGITVEVTDDELRISDTGIGIAPEDLPRIFEKGYTGFNGRLDRRASGLGLYLCRRICANLGHSIAAESEPGRGTTIRIGLARPVAVLE